MTRGWGGVGGGVDEQSMYVLPKPLLIRRFGMQMKCTPPPFSMWGHAHFAFCSLFKAGLWECG